MEGYFGHKDLDTSQSTISTEATETGATIKDATSNIPEKTPPTIPASGSLATAEIVFPLKSIPTVIAGIPEPFCLFVVLRPSPCTAVNSHPVP